MPSPEIPHYTRKPVQCPICGAFMRTTQGLNGHIRFRHMGQATGRGMLWKMRSDGFLPVIDYSGLTPDDLNSSLVHRCYEIYQERLTSGEFTPSEPRIPMSESGRIAAERFIMAVIDLSIAKSEERTAKLQAETARLKKGQAGSAFALRHHLDLLAGSFDSRPNKTMNCVLSHSC